MGGTIWAESEVDKGSTFHFTAKLGIAANNSKEGVRFGDDCLNSTRVLVVGERATGQAILRNLLHGWGACVTLASSAAEGFSKLEKARQALHPFELILVDQGVLEHDGIRLCALIRDYPPTPCIIMSSFASLNRLQRFDETSVFDYLTKPLHPQRLKETALSLLSLGRRLGPGLSPDMVLSDTMEKSLHVLVAEDNAINFALVSALLKKRRHRVTRAKSGLEVIEAVANNAFDVILMDVQMPGMDGLEATRLIRAKEMTYGGHIPIVAMTASAMESDRRKCLSVGIDGYVSKPIDIDELVTAIGAALGLRASSYIELGPMSNSPVN